MYIHAAIAARTHKEKFIARKSWDYPIASERIEFGCSVKLNPTDTPDLCIVLSRTSGATCGWRPSAEDLTADDWITCG